MKPPPKYDKRITWTSLQIEEIYLWAPTCFQANGIIDVEVFVGLGFTQSTQDYTMFTRMKERLFIIILVYVDDMLITVDDQEHIKEFTIKNLGELSYFLGIEISTRKEGISTSM